MPNERRTIDLTASLSPRPVPRELATLRTLRIAKHFPFFLAVAEEQNLHRAAERLNIAQSALSRRIADLERELGDIPLFERQARGVSITEAGRVLARDVRQILQSIEEASRRVRRVARGDIGTLRIAFTEAMVRGPLLPPVLRSYRAQYPEVEIRAFPLTSEAQRQRLRGGEIDVGFVIEEAGDAEEFATTRIGMDKFVAVLPHGHPLEANEVVHLHDLVGEPLIFPSRQHSPRLFGRMVAAFDARGVTPEISVEVSNVDIAFGLVASEMGVGIVTAVRADRAPRDIVIKPLPDLDLPLPLSMVVRKSSSSPLVLNFVEAVEKARAEADLAEA